MVLRYPIIRNERKAHDLIRAQRWQKISLCEWIYFHAHSVHPRSAHASRTKCTTEKPLHNLTKGSFELVTYTFLSRCLRASSSVLFSDRDTVGRIREQAGFGTSTRAPWRTSLLNTRVRRRSPSGMTNELFGACNANRRKVVFKDSSRAPSREHFSSYTSFCKNVCKLSGQQLWSEL